MCGVLDCAGWLLLHSYLVVEESVPDLMNGRVVANQFLLWLSLPSSGKPLLLLHR